MIQHRSVKNGLGTIAKAVFLVALPHIKNPPDVRQAGNMADTIISD